MQKPEQNTNIYVYVLCNDVRLTEEKFIFQDDKMFFITKVSLTQFLFVKKRKSNCSSMWKPQQVHFVQTKRKYRDRKLCKDCKQMVEKVKKKEKIS